MKPDAQREAALFQAAAQLTGEARGPFLEGACKGDAVLRQRLEALLAAHEQPDGVLAETRPASRPTVRIEFTESVDEAIGQKIGRYKILEKVGEGGCGMVYVAEQTEPVRRRVALKVIKLGMDTRQVIARFEAERQALAMMDHPNIAKVLDAGTTENGRPFFVMELVRGIKITDYCDQAHLSTNDRITLFIRVCQAIQHAHQKGIIHRDIKPSNILVTLHDGVPVPKVIDFGIAKATEGRLTDATVYTQLHQFIGTPVYMSPEQAEMSGLDVDTRSDIYSLGVLLYELLAGSTPFDPEELMSQGLDAMRRTIREKEPVRPSTKLATLEIEELTTTAKRRSSDTSKLVHQLKGDLDWIVMKCLEKDRTRRYETATGLALDLKRHLDNETVSARPPSVAYQLQKLVRRNKLAFTAAAAILAVLVLGIIGTTIGLVRAEKQGRLAQRNFDQARAAVSDLLAISDEDLYDIPGMYPLRLKLMQSAVERYKPFLEQPSSDPGPRAELARLYVKIAFTAHDMGDEKTGPPLYPAAFAIQKQLSQEHPRDRALQSDLGWTYIFSTWRSNRRSPVHIKAVDQAAAIFEHLANEDPDDPFARCDLALALWQSAFYTSGSNRWIVAERALALREQLVKQFPQSAEFRRDLANSLQDHAYDLNDTKAELKMLGRAAALRESIIADFGNHVAAIWQPARPHGSEALLLRPSYMWMKRDLALGYAFEARLYMRLNPATEAMARFDNAAKIYRQLVEQNPSMHEFVDEFVGALNGSAQAADRTGDPERATAYRKEALGFLRFPGEDSPAMANICNDLARRYATSNDPKIRNGTKAVELAERAVQITKRQFPGYLDTLAAAYAEAQQFDKAGATQKEAMALLKTDSDKRVYLKIFSERLNLYASNKPYHEP